MSQQIAQTVQQCAECAKNSTPNKEPLMISQLPENPWQVVGTDLFEIDEFTIFSQWTTSQDIPK